MHLVLVQLEANIEINVFSPDVLWHQDSTMELCRETLREGGSW